jgi:hypothetical protein
VLVRSGMDARLADGVSLVVPADPTSSAHRRSRAAGPGTGTGRSSVRRAGRGTGSLQSGVRPARSSPVRDPGTTGVVPPGHRKDLWSASATDPAGPGRRRRVDLCLPGGSARCSRSSRRWVEARCVQRRSRSAAGGTPSEASQDCACRVRWCSGAEFAVAVTWGRRGDRSRRARGGAEDGVQRLGAVVALCSAGRSRRAAGWRPGRSPGPAGHRVAPRPGQSRRRREGPCRPTGGPQGPMWPAGGLRRPC